jgi:CTP synthase
MFCQVEPEQVIAVHNVSSTYHVPLLLEKQGLIPTIRDVLKLDAVSKAPALVKRGQVTWHEWKTLTTGQERFFESVSIALVGKYTNLHDSYLSVIKSLEHSAMRCGKKLNLIWVDASNLEDESKNSNPADFHRRHD